MMTTLLELKNRLTGDTEAVCRAYLPEGRRHGRYWIVGDVQGNRGRSMWVNLTGPHRGHWTEYVAVLVMLRICDWVLSRRGLTASTQHNAARCGRLRDAP